MQTSATLMDMHPQALQVFGQLHHDVGRAVPTKVDSEPNLEGAPPMPQMGGKPTSPRP